MKKVHEIMTTHFQAIPATATLREVAIVMYGLDVGMLPVTDDGRLCGVITDRDVVLRAVAAGYNPTTTMIGQIMTRSVIHLYEDDDVTKAATVIEENQISRLVVVNQKDKPVGIVSRGDFAMEACDLDLTEEVFTGVSKLA
ncbi:MAG: CBS domain-containing protein [Acidiferrobacterales bacterium]